MYAVIKTGGKQYRVAEGDVIQIEQLTKEAGDVIEFNEVLLVADGDKIQVGTPLVTGAKVSGEVLKQGRGEKVHILKFRRRKHHLKQQGHRQNFTEVKITKVK